MAIRKLVTKFMGQVNIVISIPISVQIGTFYFADMPSLERQPKLVSPRMDSLFVDGQRQISYGALLWLALRGFSHDGC